MKTPIDPTRDPASELRDDHDVDEADFRDPSKEDREPKFRVPPPPPLDAPPIPEEWSYWGIGPLDVLAWHEPATVRILTESNEWSCDDCYIGGGYLHYIIRKNTPTWDANFITNDKP